MQRLSTSRVDFRCHVGRLGESTFGVGAPTLEHIRRQGKSTRSMCLSTLEVHFSALLAPIVECICRQGKSMRSRCLSTLEVDSWCPPRAHCGARSSTLQVHTLHMFVDFGSRL